MGENEIDAINLITSLGFILFSFVKYLQVSFTSTIRWTAIYVYPRSSQLQPPGVCFKARKKLWCKFFLREIFLYVIKSVFVVLILLVHMSIYDPIC